MRIHTSAAYGAIYAAAREARVIVRATEHGSRTHARAFEVQLSDGAGNAWRNSGQYGAATWDGNAATWDEWGIFLAHLYGADPGARVGGSLKRPIYADADDFHRVTCDRYRTLTPALQHKRHKWERVYGAHRQTCKCGAALDMSARYAVRGVA
jgi:hypothetical protein